MDGNDLVFDQTIFCGRGLMLRNSDDKIALVALIAFAAWLLVGLPLLYLPSHEHVHGEILGVKYGEWLLFIATAALAGTTWLLVRGGEKTAKQQLRAYVTVQEVDVKTHRRPSTMGAVPEAGYHWFAHARFSSLGLTVVVLALGRVPWMMGSAGS
jgi:hypothetical protein